ncbi:MAG: hypothetical protein MUC44_05285 [Beijerinckiaceae bacterium]|jgi:hypothetical protein|nr:hypothetical protein [Beijerinckiaceae bacterium]
MNGYGMLVMGPRSSGRGYQILTETGVPLLSAQARDLLDSLPLALAGWADTGEESFLACIPLTDDASPTLLIHGRYLGEAVAGSVAYANAVLVDQLLPHPQLAELAHAIPTPDGSLAFALAPTASGPDNLALQGDWDGFGLAWTDRILFIPVDAAPWPWLRSALHAIDPPEQRNRVRGWATSLGLPSTGSFVPARCFNLVVTAPAQVPPGWPHVPAEATDRGFAGAYITPPAAWRLWRDLVAHAEAMPVPAWDSQLVERPAVEIVGHAMSRAISDRQHRAVADLLARVAGGRTDTAAAASAWLKQWLEGAGIAQAAGLALAWAALPDADRDRLDDLLARLLARPDLDMLADSDLIAVLLACPEKTVAVAERLVPARRFALLGELVESGSWSMAEALVAARLLSHLAAAAPNDEEANYIAAGIGRLLDWSMVAEIRAELLKLDVVTMLGGFSPNMAARYATNILQLARTCAQGDWLQFSIARAALKLLAVRGNGHGM